MYKIYNIIGLAGILMLGSCGNDAEAPQQDKLPITFTSQHMPGEFSARAAGDIFPNADACVLATQSEKGKQDAQEDRIAIATNWNELFINQVFTVGNESAGKYALTSNNKLYWPFEETKYLSFVAYSPSSHAALTPNGTDISVTGTVSTAFPDLLYTQGVGAYNKDYGKTNSGVVDLGPFAHAMARVYVNVFPADKDGNPITSGYDNKLLKIKSLAIETKQTKGTFSLLNSSWSLDSSDDNYTTLYTLIKSTETSQLLPWRSTKGNCFLLPNEDLSTSRILITLIDGTGGILSTTYEGLTMDKFLTGSEHALLEEGKSTELNVYVKTMRINTGDTNGVILNGTLKDWDYKGEGSISVQ